MCRHACWGHCLLIFFFIIVVRIWTKAKVLFRVSRSEPETPQCETLADECQGKNPSATSPSDLCAVLCWKLICVQCCIESWFVCSTVLKSDLSAILCWKLICVQCCVENWFVCNAVLKTDLSAVLCWKLICLQCCVENWFVCSTVLKSDLSGMLC